jgi:hypothetical protein
MPDFTVLERLRGALVRLEDRILDVKMKYADRLATGRQRCRAKMWGEVFGMTGMYGCGWPSRYLSEFTDGEAAAEHLGKWQSSEGDTA